MFVAFLVVFRVGSAWLTLSHGNRSVLGRIGQMGDAVLTCCSVGTAAGIGPSLTADPWGAVESHRRYVVVLHHLKVSDANKMVHRISLELNLSVCACAFV